MNTLTAAELWVTSGQSVIPIGYRSKRPAFDALRLTHSTAADGHLSWEPYKSQAASEQELQMWFGGPRRNIGIVTGWRGLVVLDFDQRDAYAAWCAWARSAGGTARRMEASTYRVFSARGVHVYLMCEEPVESYQMGNIDVKARYGYVLAPPSVHPSGHEYRGEGVRIMRCEKLLDVFPFERMAAPTLPAGQPLTDDPWWAATHAVECGGVGAVERAKAALRIEDLLHLDPRRARQMILCPLHEDHNPSMVVDLDKQNFRCWGCGAAGDALDLYAALHKLTVRETIAQLAGIQ